MFALYPRVYSLANMLVQVILTCAVSLLAQSDEGTELLIQPPKSEGFRSSKEKEFKEFFQTYQ